MSSPTTDRHHAPPTGRAAATQPGRTAGTPIPGLVSANGVYVPLAAIDTSNPLMGGYGWLDATDSGATHHPGVDLNSPTGGSGTGCNVDEGLPVVAPVTGVVRAALFWDGSTPGEGNHVWVELDAPEQGWTGATTWMHVDHLQAIYCGVGDRLDAGDPLGTCGRSGFWDCAHTHLEFARGRPTSWYQWPFGWSRAQVEQAYYPPLEWFLATVTLAGALQGGGAADVSILTGAQQAAVQAVVWDDLWDPAAAEFAIPTSWREEWKAGRWRGEPRGPEQPVPASEDQPAGAWQLFEYGTACYLPGQPVSWEG